MANTHTSEAIRLDAAVKRYGENTVVDSVDLSIANGEAVALIGPSGAGKTTLLRLIAGVIAPDSGTITTLGIDTANLHGASLKRLRTDVGLMYQLDNLIPSLRVAHNVLMGHLGRWSTARTLLSLVWPQELESARKALARVELEHKLWSLPGALSGGEQQRVAVARLLVQSPKLTLADEPVSSLDVRLGREIVLLLTSLAKERQSALVISLHALDLLGPHFDRVVALRKGRVVWQGKPSEITQDVLKEVYGTEYETLSLAEIAVGAGV